MECPYCNAENRDGVRFCNNCGKPLDPAAARGSATVTSRSLTPGSRLQGSRYVIKKILGQGGMGAALLATDLRLDSKPVVIKEHISDNTDPAKLQEDVRNFKREVATLAHLDHPLIPNVTDHFQEGPRYFMVQEYVDGENLEDRMDRVNQAMKERDAQGYADPRSNLYALAATLHHILTNRDPRNHPPFTYPPVRTLNPQLSADIQRVLTTALNNDINQR